MMTSPNRDPLEINVVYSASARSPRRRASAGARRTAGGTVWLVLGLVNLAAAGGTCYAAWWRVDKFIFLTFVLKTPVPGMDIDAAAAGIFGIKLVPSASSLPPPLKNEKASIPPRFVGATATNIIGITAYSWLTMATLSACALALSAGAFCGRYAGPGRNPRAAILTAVWLLGLAAAAYFVWTKYGTEYRMYHARLGIAGAILLAALVGLSIGRGVRRLARVAAVLVILSATASAAGLYLGSLCGAVTAEQSTLGFLAMVFLVHSAYGWALFPVVSRVPH